MTMRSGSPRLTCVLVPVIETPVYTVMPGWRLHGVPVPEHPAVRSFHLCVPGPEQLARSPSWCLGKMTS
ncbi:hypothetical protein NDU88_002297 [Pleurodeles waltl]|uniref:Secreted protein n=1 Tax=Pleurodeles waltl TaxID=8319 RepID=A0AAV7NLL4_PLEWA|nr:hypothetical protein NDU88_002297 [Pleurodeles waltl]